MQKCEGCYWCEECSYAGEPCSYYYAVDREESLMAAEYEEALRDRVMDYEELVAEQQQ